MSVFVVVQLKVLYGMQIYFVADTHCIFIVQNDI